MCVVDCSFKEGGPITLEKFGRDQWLHCCDRWEDLSLPRPQTTVGRTAAPKCSVRQELAMDLSKGDARKGIRGWGAREKG